MPADALYKGDHWKVALSTLSLSKELGFELDLSVLSAGMGLVQHDEPIPSYAATFTPGDQDSISRDMTDSVASGRAWWKAVSTSNGHESSTNFEALAVADPDSPILVTGSMHYLDAIADDLKICQAKLRKPEMLMVISTGAPVDTVPNILPTDGRFRTLLGGSMLSLNARLARFVLEKCHQDLRFNVVREALESVSCDLPPLDAPNRQALSDDEVRDRILELLESETHPSHSRFLRILRDSGYACEQGRFRRLYKDVVSTSF